MYLYHFDNKLCQQGESFSKEKTPILMCGAKASFLALSIPIFELTACLKFCDFIKAIFPKIQLAFDMIL